MYLISSKKIPFGKCASVLRPLGLSEERGEALGGVQESVPRRRLPHPVAVTAVVVRLALDFDVVAVLEITRLEGVPILPRAFLDIVRGVDGVELDETDKRSRFRGFIGHSTDSPTSKMLSLQRAS